VYKYSLTVLHGDYYFERTDGDTHWFVSVHSGWYEFSPFTEVEVVSNNKIKLLYIIDIEYYKKVALCIL
jgi:hypothetical protein